MQDDNEGYITIAEAAAQWGVQIRTAQAWCRAGRIAGAHRYGRTWRIPARAPRPVDRCGKTPAAATPLRVADISPAARLDCLGRGEALSASLPAGEQRQLLAAELARLRGDMAAALKLAGEIGRDSPWYAGAQLCIFAAAGSCGDSERAHEALLELKALHTAPGLAGSCRARVETARAVAAATLYTLKGLPDWLVQGDLSHVPKDCLHMAMYAWAKHLHGAGELRQMLGVAQAALATARGSGTATELYLELMAAVALVALNRREAARIHALRAVRLAMPHGFLTPIAEHLTSLGGVIEAVIRAEWPASLSRLKAAHNTLWRGWAKTHNTILQRRLNLELTARERQVAHLITHSCSNEEIAVHLGISPAGVKQHVRNILTKLGVRRRGEIIQFVRWPLEE